MKAAVHYLTNYVTKSILKTSVVFDVVRRQCLANPVILDDDPQCHEKVRALMTKIVNNLSAKMEIGAPLACSYVLGFPDHYTSHHFASFYWQPFVHEVRSFWDRNIDPGITPKVALIKQRNCVVGLSPIYDYIYRPAELHDVSLYDWISAYKREKLKQSPTSVAVLEESESNSPDVVDDDTSPVELVEEDSVQAPSLSSCSPVDMPIGVFRFCPEHPLLAIESMLLVFV